MDRHRPLQHGIGCTGVHDVEETVDRLVTADAEDATTLSVRVTLTNLGEFAVDSDALGPF